MLSRLRLPAAALLFALTAFRTTAQDIPPGEETPPPRPTGPLDGAKMTLELKEQTCAHALDALRETSGITIVCRASLARDSERRVSLEETATPRALLEKILAPVQGGFIETATCVIAFAGEDRANAEAARTRMETDRILNAGPGLPKDVRAVKDLLNKPFENLDIAGTPLRNALGLLADISGAEFEAAEALRDTPVSTRVKGSRTVGEALGMICLLIDARWTIAGGKVKVEPADDGQAKPGTGFFFVETRAQAAAMLLAQLRPWEDPEGSREIHLAAALLDSGKIVTEAMSGDAVRVQYKVERPVWFGYVNDDGAAEWSHPVRFVFIEYDGGGVAIREAGWWPRVDGKDAFEGTDTLIYSDLLEGGWR